ncbi:MULTISPECIES: Lrp/AsnC family transcriptional regulator [Streptomyces]|uniref:Lrp/AsnC family transcriptional regulator n=1 Tax=Streptomyces tsukubensis (strain DSM 42081 / NBRC 108919 / NRRL 18488 / 9993) TaxID=1114943 RepID=I2NAF8_STRT9|nr:MULTISPECIES: Lrp/AsnC family transcriptional regulator [Streptomyces]AZK97798.1 AsnC family transcriptional regulator [Streptomyces tsukubensis]EIF94005.1 transcription regulator AsnC [Streptomyces tsukubensis NRRL18488]MYS63228.1 AsnC family transcriptional regulator [Streptomyces sp. SID5473]QKM66275.1 Lrp/AsnC family transcriptional regulator [Streptomyces tsukubensis NRRL18488]TAI45387.1 Lrp/AsnC family transcriptional regulator [Streptomyces tsukubensis]
MTRPLLDELDRRLIGALHLDPRATWDDIGGILAADASTLKRRYDRLYEARMIRVIGQADWGVHSTSMPVHVFLDISGETPLAVLHRLRDLPHLQLLAQISGDYPLYAVVHAPSEAATSQAIDRMFSVPGVRRVNALPALSTLRRGITWDPRFLTDAERDALLELVGSRPEGTATATAMPPAKPLSDAERAVVALLLQDGRASAASIARAVGMATSTAHRVVRRVLDEGWVKPRLEIVSEWLGFETPFMLRLRVAPGETPDVMRRIDQLPQTRLVAHVASDLSVLATGLVTDRSAVAHFVDHELAAIPGILGVGVGVMLAEPRRYWLDRDLTSGLGAFHAPALL